MIDYDFADSFGSTQRQRKTVTPAAARVAGRAERMGRPSRAGYDEVAGAPAEPDLQAASGKAILICLG